jgi:hypothetical protein
MPGRLVHIPLWWFIVGVATCVLTPVLSIWTSVHIAKKTQDEAARDLRQRSCSLYARILDAYDAEPPTTDTGRAVQQAYLLQYQDRGCTPVRK